MKFSDLEHKRVLILGYGLEGRATEAFLRAQVPSAQILIADQKDGPEYLAKQNDADIVIKTPGLPPRFLTKPYTTATNIFHAYLVAHGMQSTVVGVTGSKGKSTTASLIAAMVRESGKNAHLVGNIGRPALEALKEPIAPDDIFVMELSSYQCGDLDFSPHISVITSIFPEHLDYHGGFTPYVEAKKHIVAHAHYGDVLVFNQRYEILSEFAASLSIKTAPFIEKMPFDIADAKLKGAHNTDNIRGAFTVAHLLSIPDEVSQKTILAFEPLPHRMTNIGTYRNIIFVDDAIATAPEPTIFALETLGNVDTILLGGTDRGYDFAALAEALKRHGVRNVVLFPDSGEKIEAAIKKSFGENLPRILKTKNMEEAVHFSYAHTAAGKVCLLSTASPSYSVWKNFEEKGDTFIRFVRTLA
ncbi:MAG: UDP-N-acetylmuramoyl-L-alanine--D-glutamate ligase [Minisyncoccia bacterium]